MKSSDSDRHRVVRRGIGKTLLACCILSALLLFPAAAFGAELTEIEPNNDYLTATPLPVDGTLMKAQLNPQYDNDWYAVSLEEGTAYRFRTMPSPDAPSDNPDTYMYLYSSDGETELRRNDDSFDTLFSHFVYAAPTSDTYYVRVRPYGSGTGAYALRVDTTSVVASGEITDAQTGDPIEDAYLELHYWDDGNEQWLFNGYVETNAQGMYWLADSAAHGAGVYELRVSADYYKPATAVVEWDGTNPEVASIALEPVPVVSEGYVLASATQEPVASAYLELHYYSEDDEDWWWNGSHYSDSSGRYKAHDYNEYGPGRYELKTSALRFYSATTEFEWDGDTAIELDILMDGWRPLGSVTMSTVRASLDASGDEGDRGSRSAALSEDGRYVAFITGNAFAEDDDNGETDVYVKDMLTGEVERVSVGTDGTQHDGWVDNAVINADGRYVAFETPFAFDANDTNGTRDVYVYDRENQELVRASVDGEGAEGGRGSRNPSISADGRYIAFVTGNNFAATDTDDGTDVYVKDMVTGDIEHVTVGAIGTRHDWDWVDNPAISADGRYVAFDTFANLDQVGDTNDKRDVYVYDRETQESIRASVDGEGSQGDRGSRSPSISADGRYVAFVTGNAFVADDENGEIDIYVKDMHTAEIGRVSVDSDGMEQAHWTDSPAISGDGRIVVFETGSEFDPNDGNNQTDIYAHDRLSGTTSVVSMAYDRISATNRSYSPAISADGRVVAFDSWADDIVEDDENNRRDVFAALIDVDVPSTDISGIPEGWVSSDVTFTLVAEDGDGSGVATTYYRLGEGAIEVYSAPVTVSAEGVTEVSYWSVDVVGNTEEAQTAEIRIDKTAPVVTTDAESVYGTTAEITFSAEDAVSGLASFVIELDGQVVASDTIMVDEPGEYVIEFEAVDAAGNVNAGTVEFQVLGALVQFSGNDRYQTAILASQRAFPFGADDVVIATGMNWPDALGGSALAGALDGPVLLVPKSALRADVKSEIERLGASRAWVLGGDAAVSQAVSDALAGMDGMAVERIGGDNRYQTAEMIADKVIELLGDDFDGTAFVATGGDFPDALAAGPLAASMKWPLYLANPAVASGGLSSGTLAAMSEIDRTIVLGGTSAVSAATYGQLAEKNPVRLWGADRYATAATVSTWAVANTDLSWANIGIATGANFPDALAGGIAQAKFGGVMLLTQPKSLTAATGSVIKANAGAIETLTYYGGTSAVQQSVRDAIAKLLE